MRNLHKALAVGMVCLIPNISQGAGVTLVSSHGAEVSARGLAFTAKADSIAALSFNPAGLAKIKGHHIRLGMDIGFDHMEFDRDDGIKRPGASEYIVSPEDQVNHPISSDRVTPEPTFGYATDLNGKLPFTLAYGVHGPRAVHLRTYGRQTDARYMIADNNMKQAYYEIGIGYTVPALGNRLHLGASVGGSYVALTYRFSASADPLGTENPTQDVNIKFSGEEIFAPTWGLGVLADITDEISVGIGFRSRSENRLKGAGSVKPVEGSMLSGMLGEGGQIDFDFVIPVRLPDVLRLGVRYHQPDWDIEANAIYSKWSYFGNVVATLSNVTGLEKVPDTFQGVGESLISKPIVITKDYKDVWGFGVGGSLQASERWMLMTGLHYQPRATSNDTMEAIFLDLDLWVLGAGVRYSAEPFAIDFGMSWTFAEEERSTGNRFYSFNLLDDLNAEQDLRTVVGDGVYRAEFFDLFMAVTLNL